MAVTIDRRLYLAADGVTLVEDGSPDAAFLWAAEGDEVDDAEAERVGYKPSSGRKSAKAPAEDKAAAAPAEDKATSDDESHVCDACGFEAKTAAGLAAHQRSHDG